MNDEPGGRAPPTEGSRPLRTLQNCAASAGSRVNAAGSSKLHAGQGRVGGPLRLGARRLARGAKFYEERGRILRQRFPSFGHPGLAFHPNQRRTVDEFHRGGAMVDKRLHRAVQAACMSGKIMNEVSRC